MQLLRSCAFQVLSLRLHSATHIVYYTGAVLGARLSSDDQRPGVMLIPPLAGVQMEVQAKNKYVPVSHTLDHLVHRPDVPFALCRTTFPATRGWLNYFMLLPGFARCWAANMRLECKDAAHCTSPPGVFTTVIDAPSSTLHVDPVGIFSVFAPLVNALTRHGYSFGHDLVPHVYDTRCAFS